MHDIKLLANYEKDFETLIKAMRIYSQDIGMGFGIEKMCHIDNEKRQTTHDGKNGSSKSRKHRNTRRKKM